MRIFMKLSSTNRLQLFLEHKLTDGVYVVKSEKLAAWLVYGYNCCMLYMYLLKMVSEKSMNGNVYI